MAGDLPVFYIQWSGSGSVHDATRKSGFVYSVAESLGGLFGYACEPRNAEYPGYSTDCRRHHEDNGSRAIG